jgi:hypothetical protein
LSVVVFLLAGSASAGDSEARSDPVIFAGNPPALVAELRQDVLAGLRQDLIAAAKSELSEVAGRVEDRQAEWEVAARLGGG